MNSNLDTLLVQAVEERDASWEDKFFEALSQTQIKVVRDQPENGPDGWPYLVLSSNKGTETLDQLVEWASTRGIGFVLNAHKGVPDYVFTYGMLWNYRERRQFLTRSETDLRNEEPSNQIWFGSPSTSFLPTYVRTILREFLQAQGVKEPRVALLSTDQKNYDLCFSIESLGNPPKSEHPGIAEALAWFLPMHYSVALASEAMIGKEFFAL